MSRSFVTRGLVWGSLLLAACSGDESSNSSTQESTANSNQPSGGGSTSTGAAGSGTTAAAPASNGGSSSSSEGNPSDIDLNAGGSASPQMPGSGSAAAGAAGSAAAEAAGASGAAGSAAAGAAGASGAAGANAGDPAEDTSMSFFATSRGGPDGANFGGLEGADALCRTLAAAVSAELGAKDWRAYLSTTTVNARDRIGTGPWFNAAGVLVANDVDQLHDQGPGGTLDETWAPGDASIALDELGNQVPSGNPQQHDILTGTLADGTVAAGLTCGDWTAVTGNAQSGHSNRAGGGPAPSSWSSAHGAPTGCAPLGTPGANVGSGGGRGSIYCFAAD